MLLWKNLNSILLIGLPIYTILLVTMCWRSIALLFDAKVSVIHFFSLTTYMLQLIHSFQNSKSIPKIVCAIGAILFVISDTMIAIDKYYAPISNSSVSEIEMVV